MRPRNNPTTLGGFGTRPYQGTRVISTSQTRSSDRVWQGGRLWGGGGCGWGGTCGFWPWWSGIVPIAVPVATLPPCGAPIINGRLRIDGAWATNCFWPVYAEARARWGRNPGSVATEILMSLAPGIALGGDAGAEAELARRIEYAVAVLFGADGVPTPYPRRSVLPRPRNADDIAVPWIRVLVTGWT